MGCRGNSAEAVDITSWTWASGDDMQILHMKKEVRFLQSTSSSADPGGKMRTLLFGLIFGLLAVGHSSPITNVTQVPTKAEDDILQAVTDGFLVDFHGFTSETPERNTTDPPPQPTPTVPYEKDFEGSASGESGDLFPLHVGDHVTSTATTNTTTTTKPKAAQETSTALVSVPDFEGSASGESIPLFPFREVGHSSATPTTTTTITTAAPKDAPPESGEKAPEGKASVESGDMDPLDEVRSTPTPTLAAPVGPRGSRMFGINKESGSEEDLTNTDTKTGESPAPVNTDKDSRSIFINNGNYPLPLPLPLRLSLLTA
ncbi:uncharacterized protein LOC141787780 [Halichoeres trimaculatus]|uniref:uncharacterized protein LOC141787780 n=1 Tax=Halichoeres trimaculatus TaxID=147232 RepID=UPI003D9F73CD